MGLFDDLIPKAESNPSSTGLFDDLIPKAQPSQSPEMLPTPGFLGQVAEAATTPVSANELSQRVGQGLGMAGRGLYNLGGALALGGTGDPSAAAQQLGFSPETVTRWGGTPQPLEPGQTPMDVGISNQSIPGQILSKGTSGLIKSVPQLAAVGGLQALGVPMPVGAAAIFGSTEQGFDPKAAIIAAALPFLGRAGGAVAGAVAKKAGVSSIEAINALEALGGMGAVAGGITADMAYGISKLPEDQRQAAWVDAAANVGSMMAFGPMGVKFTKPTAGQIATRNLRNPEIRGGVDQAAIDALNPRNAQVTVKAGVPVDVPSPTGIPALDEVNAKLAAKNAASTAPGEPAPAPAPVATPVSMATKILKGRGVADDVAAAIAESVGPKLASETGEQYRARLFQAHDNAGFVVPKEATLPYMNLDEVKGFAQRDGRSPELVDRAVADARAANDAAMAKVNEQNAAILESRVVHKPAPNAPAVPAVKPPPIPAPLPVKPVEVATKPTEVSSKLAEPAPVEANPVETAPVAPQPAVAPEPTATKPVSAENAQTAIPPVAEVSAKPVVKDSFTTPPAKPAEKGPGIVGLGADLYGQGEKTMGYGGDIYGVARRVRDARAAAGQVAPTEGGIGVNGEDSVKWGRELIANGVDAEKVLQDIERTKSVSYDAAAVTRAHGEKLFQFTDQTERKYGTTSSEYRVARAAADAWDTRTNALGNIWHRVGEAMQGETDLETGSFTAMERRYKKTTGHDFTPADKKTAVKITEQSAKATANVEQAKLKLETSIDNLTETGKPRFSEAIIKIAENIVASLDKRADAARARIRARAFTFSANIDPTVLRDVAEIGASHIAHWGLDFARWSKAMIDEFGPKIDPHLKTIFGESQKLVDAQGDKHGANAETVKKVVKRMVNTKAPATIEEQRKAFSDFKEGRPMTPTQVKTLWTRAKTEYIDKGETQMADTVYKLASDLGIPAKDVLKGLAQNKSVKRVADDVWQQQRQARLLKSSAKRWINHAEETALSKVLPMSVRIMFSAKVALHGTVAIGTHAPLEAFVHPIITANNFGKMYKMVASPEYYQMQQAELARRPNYNVAQRNGLVNDMSKMEDFNDPALAQGFPKIAEYFKSKFGRLQGMGTRGYAVLKILRQDLFDNAWDKLAESEQSPDMAKAIVDSVNHMTGVVKASVHPVANVVAFAPKLAFSRMAVIAGDPYRAFNSLTKMSNMTPAEKWFMTNQVKEKAKIFAVATGLLLANQQLNNALGDKKKMNGIPEALGGGGWDPMSSDFMKFRVAGMTFAWGSPFLTMIRLPMRIIKIGMGNGGKSKFLIYPDESMSYEAFKYARTQASPFLNPILSLVTKADYQGRPLPQLPGYGTPPPMPKRLKAQGVKPYTWNEFATETMLPIPFQEGAKEVFHYMDAKPGQEEMLLKAFMTILIMSGTGGRLADDWKK